MSDVSQGPGWWLASDGKYYAPELASAPPPPPQAPTPTPTAGPEQAVPTTPAAGTESAFRRLAKPDSVKKGVHAALGALESSGIAKVDRKSGEVKVKKLGLAKAALRPGKTIRKAINGATADLVRTDTSPEVDTPPESAS
jgi:hypothetical protein